MALVISLQALWIVNLEGCRLLHGLELVAPSKTVRTLCGVLEKALFGDLMLIHVGEGEEQF